MNEEKFYDKWILCLYVAGMTPSAQRALANIKEICGEHMTWKYTLEVVDLIEQPGLAEADQIFAVPTLVRLSPLPVRKIIGDLKNFEQVLVGLEIHAAAPG